MRFLTYSLPEEVGDMYFRAAPPQRCSPHSIHKTRLEFCVRRLPILPATIKMPTVDPVNSFNIRSKRLATSNELYFRSSPRSLKPPPAIAPLSHASLRALTRHHEGSWGPA